MLEHDSVGYGNSLSKIGSSVVAPCRDIKSLTRLSNSLSEISENICKLESPNSSTRREIVHLETPRMLAIFTHENQIDNKQSANCELHITLKSIPGELQIQLHDLSKTSHYFRLVVLDLIFHLRSWQYFLKDWYESKLHCHILRDFVISWKFLKTLQLHTANNSPIHLDPFHWCSFFLEKVSTILDGEQI